MSPYWSYDNLLERERIKEKLLPMTSVSRMEKYIALLKPFLVSLLSVRWNLPLL